MVGNISPSRSQLHTKDRYLPCLLSLTSRALNSSLRRGDQLEELRRDCNLPGDDGDRGSKILHVAVG